MMTMLDKAEVINKYLVDMLEEHGKVCLERKLLKDAMKVIVRKLTKDGTISFTEEEKQLFDKVVCDLL